MSPLSIPAQMRAVVLHTYTPKGAGWRVEDRPVPTPAPGEVLVKIAASPLNPSDLSFMQGQYGIRKALPVVPGFEAGGRVVAVGDGVNPKLIGQKVACTSGNADGTYAEYMTTNAGGCLPVLEAISEEEAGMMLVNPLTAWALVESAIHFGSKAIVQTAAASVLGQMIARFGAKKGLAVINVVRRAEQVAMLQAQGAEHIFNSSDDNFDAALRNICRTLDAKAAIDAVGGALTDRVLRAMPNGSRITVYGGLAGEPTHVGVDQLIFRDKRVEGFWLTTWMRTSPAAMGAAWRDVQNEHTHFKSEVRARYKLDQFGEAVNVYQAQMSGGKILITP